jgi:plasmid stabilization system protein ParE
MRCRYTDTALAEVDEICSHIAQHSADAAADVAAAIERTVAMIAERPRSAPIVYANNVRARLVRGFQFRLFYEIAGDDVITQKCAEDKAFAAVGRGVSHAAPVTSPGHGYCKLGRSRILEGEGRPGCTVARCSADAFAIQ